MRLQDLLLPVSLYLLIYHSATDFYNNITFEIINHITGDLIKDYNHMSSDSGEPQLPKATGTFCFKVKHP